MKKIILSIGGLFAATFINAQSPVFNWQLQVASAGTDLGMGSIGSGCQDVAVDQLGNIYSIGVFGNTTDFDPSAATYTMVGSASNALDVYITKMSPTGNFIWAKRIGGTSSDYPNGIVVDNNNDVYISGSIRGTVDLDPGVGVYNLVGGSTSAKDFVLKLNSSGVFVWAKLLEGSTAYRHAISIDALNNIYYSGSYTTGSGFSINYFMNIDKLDASGNVLFAKQFTSLSGLNAHAVTNDAAGNIFVVGSYRGVADFDPSAATSFTLQSSGSFEDAFVLKLNTTGDFVWAKSFGGLNTDIAKSVAVDAAGNVLITGDFKDLSDFDPSASTFTLTTATSSSDVFISKLDATGNFVWAKKIGGNSIDNGTDIATDAANNVYTTGNFLNTVDFDPGAGTHNLVSNNSGIAQSMFISKLDPLGNFLWAGTVTNTLTSYGFIEGNSIFLDNTSSIFVTTGSNGIVGSTSNIIKMGQTAGVSGVKENATQNEFNIYPNPSNGILNIDSDKMIENCNIQILNSFGQVVFTDILSLQYSKIDISYFSSGIYFLSITDSKGSKEIKKLIKD